MPNPLSSWNGQLPTDVLLDSGILYIGAAIFSAQEGGLKFEPGKTIRSIPFDGQRAPIAGLDRTVEWKSSISGTIMEIPSTAFVDLEPGATTVTVAGGPTGATQVQPKAAGTLYAAGDYLANVRCVWQRGDGTYVQVRFPKCLCSKWDLTGKDKEEGKFAVTFEARLDMTVSGQLVSNPPFVMEYFSGTP
jgi:hypothetical protein